MIDQGVRAVMQVVNNVLFLCAGEVGLTSWPQEEWQESEPQAAVAEALESMAADTAIAGALEDIASALCSFDWRAATASGLSDDERAQRSGYKGGSGYRLLRERLYATLDGARLPPVREAANALSPQDTQD